MDDKDAGKESSQTLQPTLQELVEPPVGELAGVEPSTGGTEHKAPEEAKPADNTGTEDMEVTLSEAASTTGNITPMHSCCLSPCP